MTVEVGIIVGKVSAFDMDALDSRIRELVAYARERDGEDRTTLFRSLVDMFLTGKAPVKEPTRAQLLDVIEALIPHVDTEGRRTVSEILAGMSKPPKDLVHRLVRDRAALVEDLLKNAPFDEDEIIELIGQTGREHHQILATRNDLSANVWIALARAAPSAPPFEGRSTLALWRDDLGFAVEEKVEARPQAVAQSLFHEELEEAFEPQRAVAGGGAGMGASFPATVTRIHPDKGPEKGSDSLPTADDRKAASLRILRTDEDLIAARMSEQAAAPGTEMVHGDETPEDESHTLTTAAPDFSREDEAPTDIAASHDAPKYLRDPGPGGWAWRSDRDGFIKLVSPYALKVFGGAERLVGTAMLDMLGLNTKLDHPVSRAFQRRSTIHDAPISLPNLEKGHHHWTLEAAPVFSGGVFEGFEGILTPVVPAETELEEEHSTYHQPLFLDEVEKTSNTAPIAGPEPASFTDKPSVLESATDDRASTQGREKNPGPDTKTSNPIADMINSTAAAMVREAVANALPRLSPREEAERYGPELEESDELATERTTPESGPESDPESGNDEMLATLELLEEALARLTDAGEKGATAQVRLQSEIATACARALKEQLRR